MMNQHVLRLDYLGMPIQTTTDCGSETTVIHGLATALRYAIVLHFLNLSSYASTNREAFAPHLEGGSKPAHRFLKSVHNVKIERGWLDLHEDWGHNIPLFFERGRWVYDENEYVHL